MRLPLKDTNNLLSDNLFPLLPQNFHTVKNNFTCRKKTFVPFQRHGFPPQSQATPTAKEKVIRQKPDIFP